MKQNLYPELPAVTWAGQLQPTGTHRLPLAAKAFLFVVGAVVAYAALLAL